MSSGDSLIPGVSDEDAIARLARKFGLTVEPGSDGYEKLNAEIKRAYRDYCSTVLAYDRSLDDYTFETLTDAASSLPSTLNTSATVITLCELAERFTQESNLGKQWVVKTQQEKEDHLSLLYEILGRNSDVTSISVVDAQRVKETLVRYPKNRNKNPRTRGLSLEEALSVSDVERINVQTINKYLRTYGALFGWTKRNGIVQSNVFEGISVRLGKRAQSQSGRLAFTDAQIQTILRELVHNPSGLIRVSYQKWGPLIALYSGARLNEIAQIHLADIRQHEGIWCFDLNDDDDTKKLKTDASRRLVPIHSQLIALGFLEHILALQTLGHRKLFEGFSYCSKNGWGRSLGRWFNDQFLVKLEMKNKGVSFHVFRHTVITFLLQADVELALVQTIVGHERQGVTHQSYFKSGFKMSQRQEALEKLSFKLGSPVRPDKSAC